MNARYPAAVSICSIGFTWMAAVAAMKVLARMFSASDKYRDRICPSWGTSCNANNIFGVNSRGKRVGALLSDHRGTGAGARSFADGFDHSGMIFSYLSLMADVESQEWKLPILYVFRRELPDSGGPGRFRGGLTVLAAVTPYRTPSVIWKSQNTAGVEVSNASGVDGGYPGSGSQVSVIRRTQVWERLRSSEIPLDYAEFEGDIQHLPSKSDGRLEAGDVLIYYPSGGGGYGDPLERDPELVRKDVLRGAVTVDGARRHYGVVFTAGLAVDAGATRQERDIRVRQRLADGPTRPGRKIDGPPIRRLAESVEEVETSGRRLLRCRVCQHAFCAADEELSRFVIRRERPLAEAGPWLALPWRGESPRFVLVETICPSCGILLDVEEVKSGV